jgi:hypothetical protein
VSNIEDLRHSVEEKASAVRKAEEGAADLKKRAEELSKNLEEYEKDYQVCMFPLCIFFCSHCYCFQLIANQIAF